VAIFGTIHTINDSTLHTDNLTYGTGKDTSDNGKIPSLEPSTYEIPMSSSAVTQDVRTEPEYESTYAVPNVNEYATLGPNEQKVNIQ
jgi:hypothetical protein